MVMSTWRGPEVEVWVHAAAKESVQQAGEELLEDANEHVPYETGALMASGEVDVEQARSENGQFASGWDSAVSYDTKYAVPLHEHPEFNFQGQGEGKWLENALHRAEAAWPNQLAPPLIEVLAKP